MLTRATCLPSFLIISSKNFTAAKESPIKRLPGMGPSDKQEAINEFVTATNCLDETPLANDSALGDNAPVVVSVLELVYITCDAEIYCISFSNGVYFNNCRYTRLFFFTL